MFDENDVIYTDKDIYADENTIVFESFKGYTVYNVEVEDGMPKELCLVNDLGMLHSVKDVEEYFQYQH